MSEASPTSPRPTSTDLRSVTFSQASGAGHSHYDWLASPTTGDCGREAALASHSVAPETAAALTMRDIFGPPSAGSSPSAGLQSCLESRLRARLDEAGAPEYAMTSKQWATELGPPIYARRASTRRTSGKDSGGEPPTWEDMLDGWPKTPMASDCEGGIMEIRPETTGKYELRDYAMTAGWPTAAGRDWKDTPGMKTEATNPDGSTRTRLDQLPRVTNLSGWPTSQASDPVEGARTAPESNQACLGREVPKAGWRSPTVAEVKNQNYSTQTYLQNEAPLTGWLTPSGAGGGMAFRGGDRKNEPLCAGEALLAGWPTPTINATGVSATARQGTENLSVAAHTTLGETQSIGPVGTESFVACQRRLSEIEKPRLNPWFSLWLQGYPKAWGLAGLISAFRKKNFKRLEKLRSRASRLQDAPTPDVFQ